MKAVISLLTLLSLIAGWGLFFYKQKNALEKAPQSSWGQLAKARYSNNSLESGKIIIDESDTRHSNMKSILTNTISKDTDSVHRVNKLMEQFKTRNKNVKQTISRLKEHKNQVHRRLAVLKKIKKVLIAKQIHKKNIATSKQQIEKAKKKKSNNHKIASTAQEMVKRGGL